jgi:tripartite-type tricarboxylate transporter receptor subunit TctC
MKKDSMKKRGIPEGGDMDSNKQAIPCRVARRRFIGTSLALLAGSALRPALAADTYPARPVRLIVPYAPGGGSDVLARLVARGLTERMGRSVVVENRGGAGGAMGLEMVVRAPPDGYTLVLLSTSHASNGAVMHLGYDVAKDISPIGTIAAGPWILVVNTQVGINDVHGLIERARQHPGALNYASSGIGSSTHLASELFAQKAGISISHVPYRSTGLALTDLLADRVQLMLASAASVAPYVHDGRLKALCVSTAERSPILANIPTAREAGVPGFAVELWHGLAAPAGTPDGVVQYLDEQLAQALKSNELRQQFATEGLVPLSSTPQAFGQLIASDVALWKGIATSANINLN